MRWCSRPSAGPDPHCPRTQFLLGAPEDIRGDQAAALRRYERAAALLARERASFFDPRGRGTVVENRPELVRDLGLRLLSLGRHAAAFDTFECMRASGLGSLRSALRATAPDAADRARFAALVGAESSVSALRRKAVDQAVAGTEPADLAPLLTEIRAREAEVRALLADGATRDLITRLRAHPFRAASLEDLARAAKTAETAVALYWVTPANVVVWLLQSDRLGSQDGLPAGAGPHRQGGGTRVLGATSWARRPGRMCSCTASSPRAGIRSSRTCASTTCCSRAAPTGSRRPSCWRRIGRPPNLLCSAPVKAAGSRPGSPTRTTACPGRRWWGGAHGVLVSRWRVNAVSNGAWMQHFYRALAAGERTATAAAGAMRAALKDQPHPYQWAAPQLFGW